MMLTVDIPNELYDVMRRIKYRYKINHKDMLIIGVYLFIQKVGTDGDCPIKFHKLKREYEVWIRKMGDVDDE